MVVDNSRAKERSLNCLSDEAVHQVLLDEPFGSQVYRACFEHVLHQLDQEGCRRLLQLALQGLGIQDDLSGQPEQVNILLNRFATELSPHDRFWGLFSSVVSRAFPNETLRNKGDKLARQIHQLRYVFSAQQANWVREHYGEEHSDREALIAYLATTDQRDSLWEWLGLAKYDVELSYDLRESSRLHNKRGRRREEITSNPIFPDDQDVTNLKILVNWHSEFILTSCGDFALVVDTLPNTQNGVLNGASFNYATRSGHRHLELDVFPVSRHDPEFRRCLANSRAVHYRSPNRRRLPWGSFWEESFFNPRGFYASGGQSCAKRVRQFAKALQSDIQTKKQEL